MRVGVRWIVVGVSVLALSVSLGGPVEAATASPGQVQAALDKAARKVLQQKAFAPSDVNLFTPQTYSAAKPIVREPVVSRTDQQVVALLNIYLKKRFPKQPAEVSKGVALFSDTKLVALIPDNRLRGAAALLYGTDARAAIDSLRAGDFKAVLPSNEADAEFNSSTTMAVAGRYAGDSSNTITFNRTYLGADLRTLAATLAHEVLHSDISVASEEELLNESLAITVYSQFIREDPALAGAGTETSRRMNTRLLAVLNTRDAGGRVRIVTSNSANVFPGGTPLASWGSAYPLTGSATPGNAYLDDFLSRVLKKKVTGANFDATTVDLIDKNIDRAMTPSEWVYVAAILKLKILPR